MIRLRRRAAGAFADPENRLHPVVRRVLAARGLRRPEEIDYRLASLHPPATMPGVVRACDHLLEAMARGRRVHVVGDFDADGATGAAVATLGLRAFGLDAGAYVPDRMRHGYGLQPEFVEELATEVGAEPGDVLLTVDHGTSSVAGVKRARERGLIVIVCDHHLAGPELPDAQAIVNPQLEDSAFPSRALAGVGVAFYLLLALRGRRRMLGASPEHEPELKALLDLVALGTVADLVPLDRNNRILVAKGLERIRRGRMRPGLAALFEVAGRDPARARASDLAFAIAPRLNAAGRLESMDTGLRLLLADDPEQARELAHRLDAINEERRALQRESIARAEALLESLFLPENDLPPALCLRQEDGHPGIVGLIAAALKERHHRPALVFAPDGQGALRGSARSIQGFHIRDALAALDARMPGLIARFGGHAAAAGLILPEAHWDAFRSAFTELAGEMLSAELLARELLTDGELEPEHFEWEVARALEACGPFGQGFPEPLFEGVFECVRSWPVGNVHRRLLLRPEGSHRSVTGFAFNLGEDPPSRFRAVFELEPKEWNGRREARVMIRHLLPV